MLFMKCGHAVAVLAALLGTSAVVGGFEIDINQVELVFAELINLTSAQLNGKQGKLLREQGSIILFCGLVLGVLHDINRSVSGRSEK